MVRRVTHAIYTYVLALVLIVSTNTYPSVTYAIQTSCDFRTCTCNGGQQCGPNPCDPGGGTCTCDDRDWIDGQGNVALRYNTAYGSPTLTITQGQSPTFYGIPAYAKPNAWPIDTSANSKVVFHVTSSQGGYRRDFTVSTSGIHFSPQSSVEVTNYDVLLEDIYDVTSAAAYDTGLICTEAGIHKLWYVFYDPGTLTVATPSGGESGGGCDT